MCEKLEKEAPLLKISVYRRRRNELGCPNKNGYQPSRGNKKQNNPSKKNGQASSDDDVVTADPDLTSVGEILDA